MDTQILPLARNFRGVNRAQNFTTPEYSFECSDCRSAAKIMNLLGPRMGRSRAVVKTYPLLGMGLLNARFGRFRLTADNQGVWAATGMAWPGLTTPANLSDLTGMDTSATVRFKQFKERTTGFNGKNQPRVVDGAGWTLAGIAKYRVAATNGAMTFNFTPTVADKGSGSGPDGAYRYFVTACNSKKLNVYGRAAESVPSTISAEVTVVDNTIVVSAIPATHPDSQVDSWNIYRCKAGVFTFDFDADQQDFFYVGSVNIGTTTFDDTTTDDALTGHARLRFRQNVPPCSKIAVNYANRVFMTGFDPIKAGTSTRLKSVATVLVNGANVATITTASAHGFTTGQSVTIAGLTGADAFYNVTAVLTVVTSTSFTIPLVHALNGVHTPAGTGTADSGTTLVDFTVAVPDGVLGAWFRKDGESTKYRIVAVISTTQVQLERNFSGTLAASAFNIYRDPGVIYFTEENDGEACGLDGEGTRNLLELSGHPDIIAMFPYQGVLWAATTDALIPISGQGPNREDIKVLSGAAYHGLGCVGPDAWCLVDNELHFLSKRGPALLNGGEPKLYGAALNTDYLDTLTSAQLAVATMGTDDESVFVAVPHSVYGTSNTVNSLVYRYDRPEQAWWPETEMCPYLFIRQDGENGDVDRLFYLQDRFICIPKTGTVSSFTNPVDLISAALSGSLKASGEQTFYTTMYNEYTVITNVALTTNVATITVDRAHGYSVGDSLFINASDNVFDQTAAIIVAVPTTTTFTFALVHANVPSAAATGIVAKNAFPTTSGGLEQCYIRFRNTSTTPYIIQRRIVSNTAYSVTWANDGTPGSGLINDSVSTFTDGNTTYDIGNVVWKWLTSVLGEPPEQKKTVGPILVTFHNLTLSASYTLRVYGLHDRETETNVLEETALVVVRKFDVTKSCFWYCAQLESRNGAIVRDVSAEVIPEVAQQ